MKQGVAVDSSSLIPLAKADALAATAEALGPLLVPPSVWDEVVTAGTQRNAPEVDAILGAASRRFLQAFSLGARERRNAERLARQGAGAGEAEVLALGLTLGSVLMDDARPARWAVARGLRVIPCLLVPAIAADRGDLGESEAVGLLHRIAKHRRPSVDELWYAELLIRRLFE